MTDKKDNTNDEIIKARKSGMQIRDIAAKFGMDKMDVRDICKSAETKAPAKKEKAS